MSFLKQLAKVLVGFIGAALIGVGAFLVYAGVRDGFGNPAAWSRLAWVLGGFATLIMGFYLFYHACDRDMAKTIGWILDAVIFRVWP